MSVFSSLSVCCCAGKLWCGSLVASKPTGDADFQLLQEDSRGMGSPRTTWRISSPPTQPLLPFDRVLAAPIVCGCGTSAEGGRLEGNLGPTGDVDFQLLREGKFGAKGKMPGEGGASRGGGAANLG